MMFQRSWRIIHDGCSMMRDAEVPKIMDRNDHDVPKMVEDQSWWMLNDERC